MAGYTDNTQAIWDKCYRNFFAVLIGANLSIITNHNLLKIGIAEWSWQLPQRQLLMEPPLIPSPKNSFSVKRERDQTEQPKDRSSEKELAKIFAES